MNRSMRAVRPGLAAVPEPPPKDGAGVAPDELDYLFADDASAPVPPLRVPAAPVDAGRQVGELLAESRLAAVGDAEVRVMLARKLCRLLPDLPPDGRDKVTVVALRTLEQLAHDHVVRVRAALATAIKDIACAPPAVVNRLARDVERCVAEPVLHYCATLTDGDLLAVIESQPMPWALAAIARRARVSGTVATAIVDTGDAAATGILLDNEGAVIPEPALERIVEVAAERPEWHGKIASRPLLPRRLAVRLAAFVDRSVLEILRTRCDFDDQTVAEILSAVRRRVDWIEESDPTETQEHRAMRLHRGGRLDETALGDALSWGEVEFVRTALALKARVPLAAVEEIFRSKNARAITALAWRAGLSMRTAMQIQARAADIPPRDVLNARQGTDYPLTPTDMRRHLAMFGVTE